MGWQRALLRQRRAWSCGVPPQGFIDAPEFAVLPFRKLLDQIKLRGHQFATSAKLLVYGLR